MRKSDIGSVAIALFGLYLAASGFEVIQSTIGAAVTGLQYSDNKLQGAIDGLGIALLIGIPTALVLAVLPGALIYRKSSDWGARLFPDDEREFATQISRRGLLWVGVVLLGAKFLISGLTGMLSSLTLMTVGDGMMLASAWSGLVGSGLSAGAGIFLIQSRHWIGAS